MENYACDYCQQEYEGLSDYDYWY